MQNKEQLNNTILIPYFKNNFNQEIQNFKTKFNKVLFSEIKLRILIQIIYHLKINKLCQIYYSRINQQFKINFNNPFNNNNFSLCNNSLKLIKVNKIYYQAILN